MTAVKYNIELCLMRVREGGLLPYDVSLQIMEDVFQQHVNYDNVVERRGPLTFVGEVSGHFSSLKEIFQISGPPGQTNFCFLGNYAGTGPDSLRTIMYLMLLSLRWPKRLLLLRGRNETTAMLGVYGVLDHIGRVYTSDPVDYNLFVNKLMTALGSFPLMACVPGAIMATSSGIPIDSMAVGVKCADRYAASPSGGSVHQVLWSRPNSSGMGSSLETVVQAGFRHSTSGPGVVSFDAGAVDLFLKKFGCKTLVRSGEFTMDGFRWDHRDQVVTLWSTPNFANRGNCGATLEIDEISTIRVLPFSSPPSYLIPSSEGKIAAAHTLSLAPSPPENSVGGVPGGPGALNGVHDDDPLPMPTPPPGL